MCRPFHRTACLFLFGSLPVGTFLLPTFPVLMASPALPPLHSAVLSLSCTSEAPLVAPLDVPLAPQTISPPCSLPSMQGAQLLHRCQGSAELRPPGLPTCHPSPCLSNFGHTQLPPSGSLEAAPHTPSSLEAASCLWPTAGGGTLRSPWTATGPLRMEPDLPAQRHLLCGCLCWAGATGHGLEQGSLRAASTKGQFPSSTDEIPATTRSEVSRSWRLAGAGVCS